MRLKELWDSFLIRLDSCLPKQVLGRSEDWKIRIYKQYGSGYSAAETEMILMRERKKLLTRYLAVIAAVILLAAFWYGAEKMPPLSELLQRPAYGRPAARAPLRAEISYGETVLKEEGTMTVRAKLLTESEAEKRFSDLERRLPEEIKGENASIREITKKLELPEKDEKTGVSLCWFTEESERISADGSVDLIGVKTPLHIRLGVEMTLDSWKHKTVLSLTLLPAESGADLEAGLQSRFRQAVEASENSLETDSLILPEKLGDGVKVKWYAAEKKSPATAVFLLSAALCLLVYRQRYHSIDEYGKSRQAAIKREFPELVNQLLLLLSAGLVVSAALEEIASAVELTPETRRRSPLFYEIAQIGARVRESNTSFARELRDFSQDCGVREMIRFSSIVEDNMDKGSSLADKLSQEAHLLRDQQKRNAEELGQLAETKLSLPLMILLLVLVTIATAPVLFQI